jgi:hypothetical protein
MRKSVCQRCFQAVPPDAVQQVWNHHDDLCWDSGFVYCPPHLDIHPVTRGMRGCQTFTRDGTPKRCPYFLEHLVMGQTYADTASMPDVLPAVPPGTTWQS